MKVACLVKVGNFKNFPEDALCQQKLALQANHTKAILFTMDLCQEEAMNFSRSYSSPYRKKNLFNQLAKCLSWEWKPL